MRAVIASAAIAILALLATGRGVLAFDNPFIGVWVGSASDSKGEAFSTAIVITRDGHALIDYADYGCGGTLALLDEDTQDHGVFRETITYGADQCIDGGLVTLTVSEKGLAYSWAGDDAGSPVAAAGLLQGRPIGAAPTTCADCEVEARLRYHTCGGAAAYLGTPATPEAIGACLRAAGAVRQACQKTCAPAR